VIITADVTRRAIRAVRCPHCRAAVGTRCVVLSSGRPLTGGCHPSRADALADLTQGRAA
jgi:hypothetical protein